MKTITVSLILLLSCTYAFTQDLKRVELLPVDSDNITFFIEQTSITFSQKDFLEEYTNLKTSYIYTELSKEKKEALENAMRYLKKHKITSLKQKETVPELKELVWLIEQRMAAVLLRAGKAQVQLNERKLSFIYIRELISSHDATEFAFHNDFGVQFLNGRILGEFASPALTGDN